MRPHGKIKLDTAREPSFVVMAGEYDWINIQQSLKPVHSVPSGDVTRCRQQSFYSVRGDWICRAHTFPGSTGGFAALEASVLQKMEKDIYP